MSTACARSVIDCVESVRHGRKWVDPNLLRHLAMAERPSQIATSLTSREADVARLVARGMRNKEIARELHLCEGTVKMHLHHIYEEASPRRQNAAGALESRNMRADADIGR